MVRPDGFVLAGGLSRRMGSDKARLVLESGLPMALSVRRVLREVCGRVALVRRQRDAWWDDGVAVEVLSDVGPPGPGRHPLWGLATALGAACSELVVVVPCDVPAIDATSLLALLGAVNAAGAIAVDDEGGMHPLVGVFPSSRAAEAAEIAAAGGSVRSFARSCAQLTIGSERLQNVNHYGDAVLQGRDGGAGVPPE